MMIETIIGLIIAVIGAIVFIVYYYRYKKLKNKLRGDKT